MVSAILSITAHLLLPWDRSETDSEVRCGGGGKTLQPGETKTAVDDGQPTVGLSPDPSSSPSTGVIDNTETVGVKGERNERQGGLDLPNAGIICVTVIQVSRPFM